jgi:hypothetical protein
MHERPAFQRHLPQAIAALAALLASAAIFAPAPLESQSPESRTLPFMVQDGLSYAEQRRWGDAINVLAYLYERIPPDAEALSKAEGLMRSSLAHGGQVSVFAQHVHGALRKVVGSDDHCSGRLVLSADGVYYSTSLTEHSFSLGLEQLADIVPAKGKQPSSEGGLTLRTRDGKRHSIRTGTLSKSEAEIVLRLTREYLPGG